ncbi:MAG: N-succinylarginine dihydrolase [Deltaproteobacteria bacterium]|nr:N-succinylarginine dihydrolase [Deltaproteobacteria bacterium]MBW1794709.1 N-succinylarginine dihydrolase [Deltaproteobacteria bacterium]
MHCNAYEVNFDGLVGLTHHYGGLSWGNIASQRHGGHVSNPKHAALQGIGKMKFLADVGIRQAVLPPHERPNIAALRRLGFTGSDVQVLEKARRKKPRLLEACSSASAMWAANAATVSPSIDTQDRRLHITPANLIGQFHRSLEPPTTKMLLSKIFCDEKKFVVHQPLSTVVHFGDEGAANHTRLCRTYGEPGIEVFVYGSSAENVAARTPKKFPARQTLEASGAVARMHQLLPERAIFIQQNPDAIDAGVFHNDVISIGNQNILLYHEHAFVDTPSAIGRIRQVYRQYGCDDLITIEVRASEVSLKDAVASYLFNSQLVTLPDGTMLLICARECMELEPSMACVEKILDADNPIQSAHYVDVRQSMKNGGGPACLRLRVVLTEDELAAVHQPVLLTDGLYHQLRAWIEKHYRDELRPDDLADPKLLDESRGALDELTQILQLGSIYPFQRVRTNPPRFSDLSFLSF